MGIYVAPSTDEPAETRELSHSPAIMRAEEQVMSEPPATDPSAVSKPSRSRKRSAKGKPSNPRPKSAPPAQATAPTSKPDTRAGLHARDRDSLIRTAAYFRAQRRNFESGHELEDWLAAESEIEAALVEGRVQV
jgi:hypothetical protein